MSARRVYRVCNLIAANAAAPFAFMARNAVSVAENKVSLYLRRGGEHALSDQEGERGANLFLSHGSLAQFLLVVPKLRGGLCTLLGRDDGVDVLIIR